MVSLSTSLALLLLCSSCATRYDSDRLESRARSLYPEDWQSETPSEPAARSARTDLIGRGSLYLEDCLRFGLEGSAELRAAFHEWLALTERVEIVSTLPEPLLTYGEFLEEVQTRTGPQERRFGLRQSFPWPGTLRRRAAVAEGQAEAAWHRVAATRLRVASEIETSFLDYAFLGRELGITNQLTEILRGLEPVVQGRVRAGSGQEDLLRLQVEIGRLEDDLASLERKRPLASSRLARAMNDPDLSVLPLPQLEEPELQAFDPGELFGRALESSPELRSLEAEFSARRAGEEVASLHRRPNFTLAVDYLETGDALAPGTSGSGDDPILLALTVSLPVWTSSYSAREREARQSVLAMDKRIEAASAALRVAVEEQSFRMDDAARRFSLYRESLIPRANEALELTLSSYRNGAASVLDLIDSERALLEFQLSFWRACRDHAQGFAELRRIVGGEL